MLGVTPKRTVHVKSRVTPWPQVQLIKTSMTPMKTRKAQGKSLGMLSVPGKDFWALWIDVRFRCLPWVVYNIMDWICVYPDIKKKNEILFTKKVVITLHLGLKHWPFPFYNMARKHVKTLRLLKQGIRLSEMDARDLLTGILVPDNYFWNSNRRGHPGIPVGMSKIISKNYVDGTQLAIDFTAAVMCHCWTESGW